MALMKFKKPQRLMANVQFGNMYIPFTMRDVWMLKMSYVSFHVSKTKLITCCKRIQKHNVTLCVYFAQQHKLHIHDVDVHDKLRCLR